ncbi:MAG: phosphotransferase [Chloroflexota bacterium]|nr:phosphotransferase [Chloroflexota bacterium]
MAHDGFERPERPTLPPRFATLVLVTPTGEVVGSLPPLEVATPWWQEAEPVVRAVRERHDLDVTLLRLLEAGPPGTQGGPVTYLAEIARPVPAHPWRGRLDEHPLRQSWARPGGPAADLAWADSLLSDSGRPRIAPAEQVRSWNLSSLWRLPVAGQTVWLKVVPPFFAHEGEMLARLAGGPVPALLGSDGARVLMPEIPGEDLYHATLPQLLEMVALLVGLQQAWIGRTDELLAIGLPDWGAQALSAKIADVVGRTAAELSVEVRATLADFVDGLAARFELVAACGLPDTLVHGDFFPGNARGIGDSITLLDWGDCGVGHPLLDQAAFLDRVPSEAMPAMRDHWQRLWGLTVPGSQSEMAATLLAPVAAARQAVIYRMFLDNIEPSEHPYHAADPAIWLRRTAALAARSDPI